MTELLQDVTRNTLQRAQHALYTHTRDTALDLREKDSAWIVVSPARYRGIYRDFDARRTGLVTITPNTPEASVLGQGELRLYGMIVREDPLLDDTEVRLRSEVLA